LANERIEAHMVHHGAATSSHVHSHRSMNIHLRKVKWCVGLMQVDALAEFNFSCDDLLEYAANEPSDPFPHTLAQFPVKLQALQPPSFASSGTGAPPHIPAHLPAFPDQHT
jgi:hypothetical protein